MTGIEHLCLGCVPFLHIFLPSIGSCGGKFCSNPCGVHRGKFKKFLTLVSESDGVHPDYLGQWICANCLRRLKRQWALLEVSEGGWSRCDKGDTCSVVWSFCICILSLSRN